jgi:hypothetical protein
VVDPIATLQFASVLADNTNYHFQDRQENHLRITVIITADDLGDVEFAEL